MFIIELLNLFLYGKYANIKKCNMVKSEGNEHFFAFLLAFAGTQCKKKNLLYFGTGQRGGLGVRTLPPNVLGGGRDPPPHIPPPTTYLFWVFRSKVSFGTIGTEGIFTCAVLWWVGVVDLPKDSWEAQWCR